MKKHNDLTFNARYNLWKNGVGILNKDDIKYIKEKGSSGLTYRVGKQTVASRLIQVQVKKDKYDKTKGLNIINSLLSPQYQFRHGNISDISSFEIWLDKCKIDFYFWLPEYKINTFIDLIRSQHPNAAIRILTDTDKYFVPLYENDLFRVDRMILSHYSPLPINTSKKDDTLSTLLTAISDINPEARAVFQIIFQPVTSTGLFRQWSNPWHQLCKDAQRCAASPHGYKDSYVKTCKLISEKVNKDAFYTEIRYVLLLPVNSENKSMEENVYELDKKTMSITSALKQTTHSDTGQGFVPWQFGNLRVGRPNRKRFVRILNDIQDRVLRSKHLTVKPKFWVFLTNEELSEVVHLPSNQCSASSINWLHGVIERLPSQFLETPPQSGDVVIGHSVDTQTQRDVKVYIPYQDLRSHATLLGRTRVGKSTVALNMILQVIKNENRFPVVVFDPHALLIDDIIKRCPSTRLNDVIYFSPTTTTIDNEDYTSGFNPLVIENIDELKRQGMLNNIVEQRTEQVISAMRDFMASLTGSDITWGTRLDRVFHNTLSAVFDYEITTGNPVSLVDVQDIILFPKVCVEFANYCKDENVKKYLVDEIANRDKKQDAKFESSLNRLSAVLNRESARRSICADHTISITKLLEERKILLVSLNLGDPSLVALIGSMLMSHLYYYFIEKALLNERQHIPLDSGVTPTFVFCDEAPTYASLTCSRIMSEGAKRGLRLFTIMQYSKQMPRQVKDAIFENAGAIITGGLGRETAQELSTIFAGDVDWETKTRIEKDLFDLSEYKIACKMLYKNVRLPTVICSTYPPPPVINDDEQVTKIKKNSVKNYGYRITKEKINGVELETQRIKTVVKAVYDLVQKYHTAVIYDDIKEQVKEINPDTAQETVLPYVVDECKKLGYIAESSEAYTTTTKGLDYIGVRDIETHAPSETLEHVAQLNRFKEYCYRQSINCEVLTQGGGSRIKPDGVIVSEGKTWNLESETTTVTRPVKCLRNLGKGLQENIAGIIFLVSEENAEHLYRILQMGKQYHDEKGHPVTPKLIGVDKKMPVYRIVIVSPAGAKLQMKLYTTPCFVRELMNVREILNIINPESKTERVEDALRMMLGDQEKIEVKISDINEALHLTKGFKFMDEKFIGTIMREHGYSREAGNMKKVRGNDMYVIQQKDFTDEVDRGEQ